MEHNELGAENTDDLFKECQTLSLDHIKKDTTLSESRFSRTSITHFKAHPIPILQEMLLSVLQQKKEEKKNTSFACTSPQDPTLSATMSFARLFTSIKTI